MKLIKEINKSLHTPDPVEQAILEVDGDLQTELGEDQIVLLADYMHEMIISARKRGRDMFADDAAYMALEDVAGFETVPPRVKKEIVVRLVRAYEQKYS